MPYILAQQGDTIQRNERKKRAQTDGELLVLAYQTMSCVAVYKTRRQTHPSVEGRRGGEAMEELHFSAQEKLRKQRQLKLSRNKTPVCTLTS